MKRNFFTMAAAAVICMLSAGQTRATVTFDYVPEQGIYTATAGALVTVNVLLRETLTNGSTSILPQAVEDGVSTVGVRLNLTGGTAKITAMSPNTTAFTGPAIAPAATDTTAGFVLAKDAAAPHGVQPNNKTATVSTYVLGSFTVQASATPGTSTFRLLQYNSNGNSYTWTNVLDLDAGNSVAADGPVFVGTNNAPVSTFTVVVNPVPEPGSLCLLAGVAMFGLRMRRR